MVYFEVLIIFLSLFSGLSMGYLTHATNVVLWIVDTVQVKMATRDGRMKVRRFVSCFVLCVTFHIQRNHNFYLYVVVHCYM